MMSRGRIRQTVVRVQIPAIRAGGQSQRRSQSTESTQKPEPRRILEKWDDIYLVKVLRRLDALAEQDDALAEEIAKRPTSVQILPEIPPYTFTYGFHDVGEAGKDVSSYYDRVREGREEFRKHITDMQYKKYPVTEAEKFRLDLRDLDLNEKRELYEELKKARLAKTYRTDTSAGRLMSDLQDVKKNPFSDDIDLKKAAAGGERVAGSEREEALRRKQTLMMNRERFGRLDWADAETAHRRTLEASLQDATDIPEQSESGSIENSKSLPSFSEAQPENIYDAATWTIVNPDEGHARTRQESEPAKTTEDNGWGNGAPAIRRLSSGRRRVGQPFPLGRSPSINVSRPIKLSRTPAHGSASLEAKRLSKEQNGGGANSQAITDSQDQNGPTSASGTSTG